MVWVKVTVPVGAPPSAGATAAVKVTGWPTTDGWVDDVTVVDETDRATEVASVPEDPTQSDPRVEVAVKVTAPACTRTALASVQVAVYTPLAPGENVEVVHRTEAPVVDEVTATVPVGVAPKYDPASAMVSVMVNAIGCPYVNDPEETVVAVASAASVVVTVPDDDPRFESPAKSAVYVSDPWASATVASVHVPV